MRFLLPILVALASCSDPAVMTEPDAQPAPDAGPPSQYCERYQQAPAPCWNEECEVGERVCDAERVCQEWPDCNVPGSDAGPSTCFQCRQLNWCDCR
jgi:hypothetical protein